MQVRDRLSLDEHPAWNAVVARCQRFHRDLGPQAAKRRGDAAALLEDVGYDDGDGVMVVLHT